MSPDYTVYAIRHKASGRYYFGQTTSSALDRWHAHLHAARRPQGRPEFTQLLSAEGPDAFEVTPLLRGLSREEACDWERTMVERFETRGVLNVTFTEKARRASAERSRGRKASDHTRALMSEAHKRRWAATSPEAREAFCSTLAEAGAAARRGMRRVRINGEIQYVAWRADEDPIETQRERWRLKARKAREKKAMKRDAEGSK